ncbi:MAG: FHA domain-containing protein [Gemmataceae bacterium]|nr:FHA domain-containing protein [Gemmataceae bacterium]
MTPLVGLDLNASRARAVHGPVGEFALALPLDPPAADLPMVLSLEKATLALGRPGVRLLRQSPHLACVDFFACLGANGAAPRTWKAGRHQLDSNAALQTVWHHLAPVCKKSAGVVLTLPPYLSRWQADVIRHLGEQVRVPVLGSVPSVLAAAMAGYAEQTWIHAVLVVDADEHAMSLALIRAADGQAHILEARYLPHLGLRLWKDRLLNALADCCVLQSRRDPRDSPAAEQSLFEQIDPLLEACQHGRMVQLGLQAAHWYQNLVVHPDQTGAFCGALAHHAVAEIDAFCARLAPEERPGAILLTAETGRLPGLPAALRRFMERRAKDRLHAGLNGAPLDDEDFGAGLLASEDELPSVIVLSPDAPARAVHGLGAHLCRGDVPRGHLELIAPLPLPQPAEAGPPRVHFHGQDFYLIEPNFHLGSQIGCHLWFDSRRFPMVAPRHCEIIFDHRTYLLFNRSRDGTTVNDLELHGSVTLRSGDRIRLGDRGPLVRFLGHTNTRPLIML